MRTSRLFWLIFASSILIACSGLPRSGPSSDEITKSALALPSSINVVDITPEVIRKLNAEKHSSSFSTSFGMSSAISNNFGIGDVLEVSLWEAPPATLFSSDALSRNLQSSGGRSITFPEQVVGADGQINIPFAGPVLALGRTPSQVEQDIVQKLRGKANQPQVLVRLIRNNASLVTVVGEVATSTRLPLTARGERLLDAIAAAGGSKQPTHKTTVQLTRGTSTFAMPLDSIIREPNQNITLKAADILTLIYQPQSFSALGATGKNDEINFEAQGISLAQAIARVGGLQDSRADAQGVFIFRLASANHQTKAELITPDGKTPTIYRLDLKSAAGFFLAQSFSVENKDVLYVSNASAAELQKFANLIYTIALPAISTVNAVR
ncbi:polysaccharide biosynthesis/export family protein [Variovorax sp. PCZ-1]|uniref:polysaccharide biosynthesis/export family protein n=1 Tax=Variovorax sp. PCZ-1 TaxID=2835533 RepID=UPI001BCBEC4D|nr:polysaccharide biosynthesis/export family protein [Variovorax sp. PCZ-1]MBS7807667.1 polysaccharide export protein [Variovorax sp. PCZ-1]